MYAVNRFWLLTRGPDDIPFDGYEVCKKDIEVWWAIPLCSIAEGGFS
jgi:hypothetical protein